MARTSSNPKRFIISCRVNHQEMEDLQMRAEAHGVSITDLMRKCLELAELEYRPNAAGTFCSSAQQQDR